MTDSPHGVDPTAVAEAVEHLRWKSESRARIGAPFAAVSVSAINLLITEREQTAALRARAAEVLEPFANVLDYVEERVASWVKAKGAALFGEDTNEWPLLADVNLRAGHFRAASVLLPLLKAAPGAEKEPS